MDLNTNDAVEKVVRLLDTTRARRKGLFDAYVRARQRLEDATQQDDIASLVADVETSERDRLYERGVQFGIEATMVELGLYDDLVRADVRINGVAGARAHGYGYTIQTLGLDRAVYPDNVTSIHAPGTPDGPPEDDPEVEALQQVLDRAKNGER